MGPLSFAWGGHGEELFLPEHSRVDTARPRNLAREGRPMKSVLIAAALIAGAAAPSFAKTVRIAVSRGAGGVPVPCGEDPLRTCHNRWHPEIPDAAEADLGDTVIFETRDAFDNPFNRRSTRQTVAAANLNLIHPLTGPLHVRGAKRGDVLAVTMIDVGPGPDNFGYTVAVPGFGFLRDVFTDPAIVRWELGAREKDGKTRFATSCDLPGVRLPLHGCAGTVGVELALPEIETAFAREEELRAKQGFARSSSSRAKAVSISGRASSTPTVPAHPCSGSRTPGRSHEVANRVLPSFSRAPSSHRTMAGSVKTSRRKPKPGTATVYPKLSGPVPTSIMITAS